nr:hypothetical protein [uncultured bacterium]
MNSGFLEAFAPCPSFAEESIPTVRIGEASRPTLLKCDAGDNPHSQLKFPSCPLCRGTSNPRNISARPSSDLLHRAPRARSGETRLLPFAVKHSPEIPI